MRSGKKPKYNMWQNTGFMIGRAWCTYKSVIFLCIPLAFATAGTTVTDLGKNQNIICGRIQDL